MAVDPDQVSALDKAGRLLEIDPWALEAHMRGRGAALAPDIRARLAGCAARELARAGQVAREQVPDVLRGTEAEAAAAGHYEVSNTVRGLRIYLVGVAAHFLEQGRPKGERAALERFAGYVGVMADLHRRQLTLRVSELAAGSVTLTPEIVRALTAADAYREAAVLAAGSLRPGVRRPDVVTREEKAALREFGAVTPVAPARRQTGFFGREASGLSLALRRG